MQEKKENRFSQKRVDEKTVILLGLVEPQLMHLIPSAEPSAFGRSHQLRQRSPGFCVTPDKKVEKTLKSYCRENCLVQRVVDKAFLVQRQQLLGERRPSARRCDDKNRLLDRLALEPGEEQMIKRAASCHNQPHDPVQGGEQKNVTPSPHRKRCFYQCQILGLRKEFQVNVHCPVRRQEVGKSLTSNFAVDHWTLVQRQMKSLVFVVALVLIGLVVAFSLLRSEHRKENDAMNSLMVILPYKYEAFGFSMMQRLVSARSRLSPELIR